MRLFVAIIVAYVVLVSTATAEPHQHSNQISFSITTSEQVDSDLLVVRLFVQHQADSQAQAANMVNNDMAWALGLAKAVGAVKAETLDYRTNPIYDNNRIRSWQSRQTLRLESTDSGALTKLLGTLQERLAIESLAYEVSPAVRKEVELRLVVAAIEAFSSRAETIRTAFLRKRYSLVAVNINSQGGHRPPIAYRGQAMAMKSAVAEPSIAAGQQALSVSVNGTIELSDD